ncbi:hypothetical protein J3R30DRAFT_2090044 [Lentinula aciculospora]|uniref:Uncharacterized protein n=1 Tax=Lentinula aciculospora TaxID=153920 RepID=A0A9W8ZUA7_9AGAR|nr:hypothetical protein J3R30DRAFT_2090044 [Lentinula aciculospora]
MLLCADIRLYFTRNTHSWLLARDLEYIKAVYEDAKGRPIAQLTPQWPPNCNSSLEDIRWPHRVNPPELKNSRLEQSVLTYGSTSRVVIRHGPIDLGIRVTLYGWDWARQDVSRQGLKIYNGFDVAIGANEGIIREGYDGNIGLGPRLDGLYESTKNFFAAIEGPDHVEDPSVFIIRLLHPAVLEELIPWDCRVFNLISFGPNFPFQSQSTLPA